MSKHHVFSSFLKRPCDDHRYSADPFVALAELNAFLEEAKKQTVREFSRKRPDSMGDKFFIASIAFRASRKRHFGTFMRCCEAWKLVASTRSILDVQDEDGHSLENGR